MHFDEGGPLNMRSDIILVKYIFLYRYGWLAEPAFGTEYGNQAQKSMAEGSKRFGGGIVSFIGS